MKTDLQKVAKPQTQSKLKAATAVGLAALGAGVQSAYAIDLSGAITEVNAVATAIEPLMDAIIGVVILVIGFGVFMRVSKRF